jgi:hypothetical protein
MRVPEPAAYVLNKLLIYKRRKGKFKIKAEKDLRTLRALTGFLLQNPPQKLKLKAIFTDMPLKWQKEALKNAAADCPEIYKILTGKPV